MTILIIDDDPPTADMLAEALHDAGYHTAVAYSAVAGIAAIQQQIPRVIILDLYLPELIHSANVLNYLQAPELRTIPVIAVTAAELRLRPRGLDAAFILEKPFNLHTLYATLNALRA